MKIQALLATAPFGPLNMPSIGLTLLKGFAHAHGFCAEINYVNMDFANKVGVGFYNLISVGYPENTNLAGDFLFSTFFYQKTHNEIESFIFDRLFGDQTDDRRSPFAKKFGDFAFHLSFIEQYRQAIALVPSWVESTAKYLAERNAGIYGFTSMFQQNLASLALARRLKQLRPGCLILLGGPNCEHPMSEALLAEFPFIDMVCSGEGEEAFVSVLQFNESGCTTRLHPNLRTRSIPNSVAGRKPSPLQITNIESLAVPDYDDYFSQLSSVLGSQDVHPRVLLETSRGCWWGEKAHCTFCGLNGASMAFRSKSAEKALSEITTLRDKHPEAPISVVDNIQASAGRSNLKTVPDSF